MSTKHCPTCGPFQARHPASEPEWCPHCGSRADSAEQAEGGAIFIGGLDLGRRSDHSALAMLEQTQPNADGLAHYLVRGLQRWPLMTEYASVVTDVKALTAAPPLADCDLVVDATGCGDAVVGMLRRAGLRAGIRAVLITAGAEVNQAPDGTWKVAKRQLVSHVVSVGESGRLKFAKGLKLARVAERELATFSARITAAGNETFEAATDWREGAHDDIVLSIALAVWAGESFFHGPFKPTDDPRARSIIADAPPGVFLS
jgi:hypothetical protein